MNAAICEPLTLLNIHPVLLDVGAAGPQPKIWQPIAHRSFYVGFDPDHQELQKISNRKFYQTRLIHEAITEDQAASEVPFYLTRSSYCSSRLKPDSQSLASFLFSDLFEVERETQVRATNLNAALDRLNLRTVDWIKLDTQGTDLRLFKSLREEIQGRVLALDVEPGLIDAYQGEDLFVDTHRELTRSGFWLSSIEVRGATRMRRSTLDHLSAENHYLTETMVSETTRQSPAWCEARYFRTIESLAQIGVSKRDYALLWVFALLDHHFGVALDLALEYERVFGSDPVSLILKQEPLRQIQRHRSRRWLLRLKSVVPVQLKRILKGVANEIVN
jgi:FkbM family methyltransferase